MTTLSTNENVVLRAKSYIVRKREKITMKQ